MNTIENLNGTKETFLPIDTQPIFDKASEVLNQFGIPFEVGGHIQSLRRHRVELTLPTITYDDGASELKARIVLSNANDGTRAFHIAVGFLRMVCTNGLVVGVNTFSQRIIHRNGPKAIGAVEQMPERIEAALTSLISGTAIQSLYDMQEIELSEHQAIEILGNLPVSTRVKDRSFGQWLQPETRRIEDQPNNLYSAFNVINENLRKVHGANSQVYHTANDKLQDELFFLAANV